MDAKELLRNWPDWSRANAARVLNSPAWRMTVRFGEDADASLTRLAALPSPAIELMVRLDGEDHRLAVCPSSAFTDLWLLRERLAELPSEVVLALVEKECGVFFQFVEDTFRVSFEIKGLSSAGGGCEDIPATTCFSLSTSVRDFAFALDLTPELELKLGSLDNLDVTHEAIRSLTREAYARHAEIALSDDEAARLAEGDYLILPEGSVPVWLLELPVGDAAQAVSSEKGALTFAQLADDALPPVPPTATLTLIRRGQTLATAEPSRVGQAKALRILSTST